MSASGPFIGLASNLYAVSYILVRIQNLMRAAIVALIRSANRIRRVLQIGQGYHNMRDCVKRSLVQIQSIRAYAGVKKAALLCKLDGLSQLPALLSNNPFKSMNSDSIRRRKLQTAEIAGKGIRTISRFVSWNKQTGRPKGIRGKRVERKQM